MLNDKVTFSRRFQMWTYTVGHKTLLLRSPKATGLSTRVDILFKNVAAIQLPTTMEGLAISEATAEEAAEFNLQRTSTRLRTRKAFIVRGSNFAGYVIAGAVAWHEDECEYYEPSHYASVANTNDNKQ
jgi:hypothetical protein